MFSIRKPRGKGITCDNCDNEADIAIIVEPKRNVSCQPLTIELCKDCFVELYAKLQSEFWNNDNLI